MLRAKSTLLFQKLVGNRSSSTTSTGIDVARRSLATLQSTQTSNYNNDNNNDSSSSSSSKQGNIITFLGLNNLSDNPGAIKKVRTFTNKQTHEIFFFHILVLLQPYY